MILLTGATGVVGSALLRRLTATGTSVRCLVRDPRRLGAHRVRVQIALGDLSEPQTFRHALRGVSTVVHLGASIRDQPGASIEELNGVATWRLVEAAGRSGVERFVFFTAMGATPFSHTRFLRSKALAEEAVEQSGLHPLVFAPSMVYSPGDPFLTLQERIARLSPVMPLYGRGRALYQPIWADDVADCTLAALERDGGPQRYDLAGPETLSYRQIVELVLRAATLRRPIVPVPRRMVHRGLSMVEAVLGGAAFATPDEVELMEVPMTTDAGPADAQKLGVSPQPMAAVLGIS